jgi:hypothetical protein
MRVSPVVLVLLAVAGCGSGTAQEASTQSPSADTSRVEMVLTRTDKQGRMVMSGLADYDRSSGVIRVKLEGAAEEIPEAGSKGEPGDEVRIFGNTSYAEWTIDGKEYWAKATDEPGALPDEVIAPSPGAALTPKEAVALILAAGTQTSKTVEDEVRGTPTTRYRVIVNPRKLVDVLPPGRRPDLSDPGVTKRFPVEFWEDEQKRARRIRIRSDMYGGDSMTVTYEFFDFGIEVNVARPPEDKVLSQEELDRMTEPTPEELQELCREELPDEECARMEKVGG